MEHYNKREKTANLLFKIIEYGAIAFGVNALLPESPVAGKTVLAGLFLLTILFVLALIITPERDEK